MQHIETLWAIVVRSSSIDIETNAVSLFHALEEINFKGMIPERKDAEPIAAPVSHELIALFARTDDLKEELRYELKFRMADPNGRTLFEGPAVAVFAPGKKRLRLRVKNDALFLTIPGEYRFQLVSADGTAVADQLLDMTF